MVAGVEISVMALVKEANSETLTGNQPKDRLAVIKSLAVWFWLRRLMTALMITPEQRKAKNISQSSAAKAMIRFVFGDLCVRVLFGLLPRKRFHPHS